MPLICICNIANAFKTLLLHKKIAKIYTMPLRQAICMVKSHRNWPKFDLRLCNVSNAFNFAYVIAKSQIHLIHYKYIKKW